MFGRKEATNRSPLPSFIHESRMGERGETNGEFGEEKIDRFFGRNVFLRFDVYFIFFSIFLLSWMYLGSRR